MFGYGELFRNQADVQGAVVKKVKEGVGKFDLCGKRGLEMISTKVRSRQSSWRNKYVWLKIIEKECAGSDVVTSEILWFAFGFGGKTRPTVEGKGKREEAE